MTQAEDFQVGQIEPTLLTPGKILEKAREARGYSHIDVAKHLNLKVQWIVDMEHDDYKDQLALIYVRGYMRSYARFVGIDPQLVMDAFSELKIEKELSKPKSGEEQFVMRQPILSYSAQRSKRRRVVRWIGVILLVVLVAIVLYWWHGANKTAVSVTQPQLPLSEKPLSVGPSNHFASSHKKH